MQTLIDILLMLLNMAWWVIIIQAILSWLIAFDVLNLGNDLVGNIWETLNRMTEPLYAPIRRIMPNFGALDLSPMVVLILIAILMRVLHGMQMNMAG